jgi:hypothetical protein
MEVWVYSKFILSDKDASQIEVWLKEPGKFDSVFVSPLDKTNKVESEFLIKKLFENDKQF